MKKILLALVAFGFAGAAYANEEVDMNVADEAMAAEEMVDMDAADAMAAPGRPGFPNRPGQPNKPGQPNRPGHPGNPGHGPGWGGPGHGGPGHGPGWGRPQVECVARNVRGQRFLGRDFFQQRAQREAMVNCRQRSGFIFGRTCRLLSCYRTR